MKRRGFLRAGGTLAVALPQIVGAQAKGNGKVFRYAFPSAETGFDPAQISDLYSRTITSHIYDSLYAYDYLARPARMRPSRSRPMCTHPCALPATRSATRGARSARRLQVWEPSMTARF
jgi:ABC-type oligopeptide transport system substrate-binding subunit